MKPLTCFQNWATSSIIPKTAERIPHRPSIQDAIARDQKKFQLVRWEGRAGGLVGAALSHASYGVTRWAGLDQLQKQKATSDKADSRV